MLTDCKQNVNSDLDIDIVLDKEKEQAQIPPAPAYVQEPLKTNKDEFQSFLSDAFVQILNHNKYAKHKIPISNNLLYFTQKEGRQLLELSRQYETSEIKSALENYLKVANSETWKSGFSFGAFCKNISEYTTQFFDMTKYVDLPKDEDIEKLTEDFADLHLYDKWFDYAVFCHHRKEWILAGKPMNEAFKKWADELYLQDKEKGILNEKGGYLC
jgi:hypothetical protein